MTTLIPTRLWARPVPLALFPGIFTAIPGLMAPIRCVQVPTGTLPEDARRLAEAPLALVLRALGGATFGLVGPVQFLRALRHRFGTLHRLARRIFAVSGTLLAGSGIALLVGLEPASTPVLTAARAMATIALPVALAMGLAALRDRDLARHRGWVIRACAIGMGSGTIAPLSFPLHLFTGAPPGGLVIVLWWALTLLFAETLIRRIGAFA